MPPSATPPGGGAAGRRPSKEPRAPPTLGRAAAGRRAAAHRARVARSERGVPQPARRDDAAPRGRGARRCRWSTRTAHPETGHEPLPGDPRRKLPAVIPDLRRYPRGDGAARRAVPADPQLRLGARDPERRHALRHVLRRRAHLRQGPQQARPEADAGAGAAPRPWSSSRPSTSRPAATRSRRGYAADARPAARSSSCSRSSTSPPAGGSAPRRSAASRGVGDGPRRRASREAHRSGSGPARAARARARRRAPRPGRPATSR